MPKMRRSEVDEIAGAWHIVEVGRGAKKTVLRLRARDVCDAAQRAADINYAPLRAVVSVRQTRRRQG